MQSFFARLIIHNNTRGRHGLDRMDLQQSMQSVPITTNVVSSNPAQCEMYSMQNFVIKLVSDLLQVVVFFTG